MAGRPSLRADSSGGGAHPCPSSRRAESGWLRRTTTPGARADAGLASKYGVRHGPCPPATLPSPHSGSTGVPSPRKAGSFRKEGREAVWLRPVDPPVMESVGLLSTARMSVDDSEARCTGRLA